MVITEESIMYRNVAWYSYVFHYSEFDQAVNDFNERLVNANLTINGPLFYALHNAPVDEMMYVDICIPVEQSYVSSRHDLNFQTYYLIDDMLSTRVIGNFEKETEVAYERLFTFSFVNELKIVSPIYHILRGDEEVQWVDVKIKVLDSSEDESEREVSLLDKYSR